MRARWVPLAVSLSVLVVACASPSSKAHVLPTLTEVPIRTTIAATPSAVAASPATPESAAAFARYWYQQIERAYVLRDPSLIERLSAPGCSACARYVGSITTAHDKNERVVGVTFDITFAEAPAISGKTARVDVIYNAPATHRYDSTEKQIHSEPAVHGFQEELTLVRVGTAWLVQADTAV